MYLAEVEIENFRCFGGGESKLVLPLTAGFTAVVGENDTGKTAVIDALRFVLGTRDQEYSRIEDHDFHWALGEGERRKQIRIRCKFDDLSISDKGAFAEYLTYVTRDGAVDTVLYVTWTASYTSKALRQRGSVVAEFRSGVAGDGPIMDAEARGLLRATYLRPLRDAERAMSSGRGSRLAQILQNTREVAESGNDYDRAADPNPDPNTLSVLGVGDYASELLANREGIQAARKRLNEDYLEPLSFRGNKLTSRIGVSAAADRNIRLRQLLEKLELELKTEVTQEQSNRGLGSNNLLFMACELLLLGSEAEDLPLLLIEEPEAHLHPQRQLRLMKFLQNQANLVRDDGQKIQIIVTTHSPNLASAIELESLVMIQGGRAYSMRAGLTMLDESDYRFLERFLDVTKANMFFARGVVIVEGDGENILLPALARLIGMDFTEHGVSVVNVGHTGLRRFARVFQRADAQADGVVAVPVACVADSDIMPACAPLITGRVKEGEEWPERSKRRWRAASEYSDEELEVHWEAIRSKASGQNVKTFVADQWTFEYDLAYYGLAEDVWVAAHLAQSDEQINHGTVQRDDVESTAKLSYAELSSLGRPVEELASTVYALFTTGTRASKAVSAQYLAERLERRHEQGELTAAGLTEKMPPYLIAAIKHVTTGSGIDSPSVPVEPSPGQ